MLLSFGTIFETRDPYSDCMMDRSGEFPNIEDFGCRDSFPRVEMFEGGDMRFKGNVIAYVRVRKEGKRLMYGGNSSYHLRKIESTHRL